MTTTNHIYSAYSAAKPKTGVEAAIARASQKTGADFSYLMQKANVESSMNPNAKAKTSSAQGLYQFVEKTWLQMVRDHGDKYGLSKMADCIDDKCNVTNASTKKQILDLRRDPELSAVMAAEYAASNAKALQSRVGNITDIGDTELYLAHFLGANGAAKFIQNMHNNPDAAASKSFSAEAHRNPGVFYKDGKAQSYQDIYNRFAARFNDTTKEAAMPTPTPATSWQNASQANDASSLDRMAYTNDDHALDVAQNMIDRLLSTPANTPTTTELSDAIEKIRTVQHQSALLVMAQTYAHDDPKRYNA